MPSTGYEWGQKAHEDLIVTKGKGFTKEKNKKKRGSYRGGRIDTSALAESSSKIRKRWNAVECLRNLKEEK